jgi:hypothetical protein
LTGRLRGLRQQAHVDDLVGHRLFDDQDTSINSRFDAETGYGA